MPAPDSLGKQWADTWSPGVKREKMNARRAIKAAREARLAGDPNAADYHRRVAATARGTAQDSLEIPTSSPTLGSRGPGVFRYGDTKPTRRLP